MEPDMNWRRTHISLSLPALRRVRSMCSARSEMTWGNDTNWKRTKKMRSLATFLNRSVRISSDCSPFSAISITSTRSSTICCSRGGHRPLAGATSFLPFCSPKTWVTSSLLGRNNQF